MKMLNCRAVLILLAACFSAQSHAADNEALQAQIDALSQRVAELEKRLGVLDSPQIQEAIKKVSGPSNPGDSSSRDNWGFLKVGYDYNEVEELLGKPLSIKKGGMEFWYYSDKGLEGPFVKFLFRKVNSWKAPESFE